MTGSAQIFWDCLKFIHRYYLNTLGGPLQLVVVLVNNKNKSNNSSDTTFIKQPWYQPSGKPAPKGDAALEAFIDKCSHDFLDTNNKRKIKDNLTKGQRSALIELKNLPNTMCCLQVFR